jgi:D-3-phosphoglycerate dehydrogenase / 2-oxoglutarate reductase
MKVLICDSVQKSCIEVLEKEGIQVDYKTGLTEDQLVEVIPGYDGVIVRSATKITEKIINSSVNLKYIGRGGSGVDTIDVPAASRKGIVVMNVPGGNTISVVELTIALMLSLIRHIPNANGDLKSGKWEKKKYMGSELFQKTLGILGIGKIGSEVAKRCKAFSMKVIGYDPFISEDQARQLGIDLVPFDTLFKESDFISIHVPGGPKTKNLVSEKEFSICKDGVRIINCARAGIINEPDLIKYLDSGKIAGAAVDVFSKEPPDADDPLINHPKVIVMPHLGASTIEAQERVGISISHQMANALKGMEIVGAVNLKELMKKA